MEVYEYSTEAEARARTGRKPFGLKWIDTNQGSAEAPRYRSCLVCSEVRHKGVEPIFSATPPLELLLSVACHEDVSRVEDPFLLITADVSGAHSYADAVGDDCQMRTPSEAARRVWETAKEDVRFFGCCPTLGRTPCSGLEVGGFLQACHLRATSSIKACKRTCWCTVTSIS